MVLDDVPDDAVLVKVPAAPLRAKVLAEDDLHVPDILPAPERLEHQVGKSQHLQSVRMSGNLWGPLLVFEKTV